MARNRVYVRHFTVCGTNMEVWQAWEPTNGQEYAAITFENDVEMGRIGTKELPAPIANMPSFSEERIKAVKVWQNAEYMRAYGYIIAEWPELENDPDAIAKDGEIVIL